MKKRMQMSIMILVVALLISAMPVCAVDLDPFEPIPPVDEYINLANISAGLSIPYNGYARCSGAGNSLYVTDTCYISVSLYRQNSSGTWTPIKTWNASGSPAAAITKNYYVQHGYNYKVVATVTVYNSAGTYIETVSKTSNIVFY